VVASTGHSFAFAIVFITGNALPSMMADFERERIDAFDAAEVDAVTVLRVFAVADVRKIPQILQNSYSTPLVPEVYAQVAQVVVWREVGGRNYLRRDTTP